MSTLPPRADVDQLRRQAKDRLAAARRGEAAALAWFATEPPPPTLAIAQRQIAREHGFASWPALVLEVARRRVLDLREPAALAEFVRQHDAAATRDLQHWRDHPRGASPLGYLAMSRYDTAAQRWRDVRGTAAAAHVLLAAGAPVDGPPGAPETPLITAASYGDAELAAVLVAGGADLEAVAAPDAGGVPGGTALRHAAVFGMTEVLDVLVAAGAKLRSPEDAAAAGRLDGWLQPLPDRETLLRALVMAADHQRLDAIAALVAAGAPVDAADARFGRHPLRLAAANGRPASVAALLALGADPCARDRRGCTALALCEHSRERAADPAGHEAVRELLTQAMAQRGC